MHRLLALTCLFIFSCESTNYTQIPVHFYYQQKIEINDPISFVYRDAQLVPINRAISFGQYLDSKRALQEDNPVSFKFCAFDKLQVTWSSEEDSQYFKMDTSNVGIQIWLEKRPDESIFLIGQIGNQELYRPFYWFQKGASVSEEWHFRYQEHLAKSFSERLSKDFNAGLIYGLELSEGDTLHTLPGAVIFERT